MAKTTLAANLGAFWARKWRKSVLLIDLDYQGSLSSMALRSVENWFQKGQDSLATRAISGDLEPNLFVQCAKEVPEEPRLKIIPAYYDLAQADNRLIVEWLLQCRPRRNKPLLKLIGDFFYGKVFERADVRYNLFDLLQSKAVHEAFDIVIIDCPPRITTGVIQALCAATDILIPTILDLPSAEAAVSFCEELETLRKNNICPKLRYAGIVGTMVSHNVDHIAERQAMDAIRVALKKQGFPSGLLDERHFVRERTSFVNHAHKGIAYLTMPDAAQQDEIRQAIGSLAEYLANQVGLRSPQPHQSNGKDVAS